MSALPSNTQFTERGVKESGYVSLGKRTESTRSLFSTARSTMVKEANIKGKEKMRAEKNTDEKQEIEQLQEKRKTKAILEEIKTRTCFLNL